METKIDRDADLWTRLLASTTGHQSQTATTARRLPMVQADVRMKKTTPRRLADVDAGLLGTLRGLCAGKLRWPLFLHGTVGTGKTCAALALCDVVRRAAYCTAEDAADWIMNGGSWDWVRDADLRCLTSWARGQPSATYTTRRSNGFATFAITFRRSTSATWTRRRLAGCTTTG